MLKVNSLSVSYGKRLILEDLSFSLPKGSFTALLGLNGSGKSTLLSALGGSVPSVGEVRVAGEALSSLMPRERAKRMALLPQTLPTPPFTVAETVLCGRSPYMTFAQRPAERDLCAVREAMEKTGVSPLAERLLSSLSGGERQMTLLAMVLAQDTPLLLLDEPTSFLDKARERRFWEVLSDIRKETGLTVLAAMHDLTAAARVADRALILSEGRTVFDGETEELLSSSLVEDIFGVRRYPTEDGPVFV